MKPESRASFDAAAPAIDRRSNSPLVRTKRQTGSTRLADLDIVRNEARTIDQRETARYPLDAPAVVQRNGKTYDVILLNVSGGGALVEGNLPATLWESVVLVLGEFGEVESVVRWTDEHRFGLEFAHETQLEAGLCTRVQILREGAALCELDGDPNAPSDGDRQNPVSESSPGGRERRHPLIWRGEIWDENGRVDVRLRNISSRGAMVQTSGTVCAGSRVLLELGEAGNLRATVRWVRGDQAGLAFDREFDLLKLGKHKPNAAPKEWFKPDYLTDDGETSPWASRWDRLTVPELRRTSGR